MSPTNRLYHITHIDHVESIVRNGLLCDNEVNGRNFIHIAYAHLKERRQTITAPPGGHISDYVPFYFAPRSPMLYLIDKGEVETYQGGQTDVVHLVTTIQRIIETGSEFFYSDRNACTEIAEFKTNIKELDEHIDWEVMESTMWNNTPDDPDRIGRRMAEFLVKGSVHWNGMWGIGVYNEQSRSKVESIFSRLDTEPVVKIKREWYY